MPDWFHEREKPREKQEEKVETVAKARERKKLGELIAAMPVGEGLYVVSIENILMLYH